MRRKNRIVKTATRDGSCGVQNECGDVLWTQTRMAEEQAGSWTGMTRSIGDMSAASVGVTAEPEIKVFPDLSSNDKFLVIASDGIWDRLSNQEIMMTIGK